VHFPEGANIADVSVVRDEREPLWKKAAGVGKAEPFSNN
jgi:hypothetical protein